MTALSRKNTPRSRKRLAMVPRDEARNYCRDPRPEQDRRHGPAPLPRSSTNQAPRVLAKMLDENEFLSSYGIRSLSRYHAEHPYVFHAGGQEYGSLYLPAESDTGMFGGNSNWRGPIWMPVNALIVRRPVAVLPLLRRRIQGGVSDGVGPPDDPVPGGRGDHAPAREHLPQGAGRAAAGLWRHGKIPDRPALARLILFYEYFHGDNGAGLGASHQTGWTGIVARGMHLFATLTPGAALGGGKKPIETLGAVSGHVVRRGHFVGRVPDPAVLA